MPSLPSRFCAMLLLAGLSLTAIASSMSPVGEWNTIDDKTHKPKSIVSITEQDGVISGKVVKIVDPAKQDAKCDKCAADDPRKDQPVLGMSILTGLKPEGDNVYGGGKILDPDNGKIYNAKLTVIDGGKKLEMRGSFLFFWRTQTWLRVE
ncbi:MAG TPA: DUF2147 domain-containing protein [Rhodocyclaceae bacterium]|nr:DUF2147 domain-containing protein [Rhodocyclaceae bacterium]